jgi:DNA-binding MarR family transcriptional regulator
MSRRATADADSLRGLIQRFVRGFGLLDEAQTPCGQPMHTSHAHALMFLLHADGQGVHQSALARQLGIDKSNASRLVRALADEGQVEIVTARDDDARLKRVRLTAAGERVARAVEAASQRRFAELLGAIAPAQRRTVLAGLEQLNLALERSYGGKKHD